MSTKAKTKRETKNRTRMAIATPPLESVRLLSSDRLSLLSTAPIYVVYAFTIFLGAFLLFQVQLILGKFMLPRFGGGPSVWSTSLLTFQCLLLAGYGYAAVLTSHFTRKTQAKIHFAMLSASAVGWCSWFGGGTRRFCLPSRPSLPPVPPQCSQSCFY